MLWVIAPSGFSPVYLTLPFLIAGATNVGTANSVTHYFLQTVPEEKRVAASMFIAVVNGAGAGIVGMLLAGVLLDRCTGIEADSPLTGYRLYFALSVLLLSAGIWVISRLTPLPPERRKIRKSWNETV